MKYKKLIAAGCSFIQGCELGDENGSKGYSEHTYPALIAKHFDLSYECLAYGGASNTSIAHMILNHDISDSILLVQWTYEWRVGMHLAMECNADHRNGTHWFDFAPNNWLFDDTKFAPDRYIKKLVKMGVHEFTENFYKYLGNDNTFLYLTDLAMKSVLYYAQQNNSKPIFFTASPNLQGMNGCRGFGPDNIDFLSYCTLNNCPIAPMGHPLHQGHRLTADYVLQNVNIKDD